MSNLQLHYYLDNELHSMDAFIKNKAESELLKLFSEIALALDVELDFEVEAIQEGGIKELFKLLRKKKTKKQIKDALLKSLGTIFLGVVINLATNYFSEDSTDKAEIKEERRLNIKYLSQQVSESTSPDTSGKEIGEIINSLNSDYKIKIFKSRFYSHLLKEPNINSLSMTEMSSNYKPISKEVVINRQQFDKQVLSDEELTPVVIENASIEIVAPVLKPSEMKWRALYQGVPISFILRDSEFKSSVLKREYSFSNGTIIKCRLEIKQGLNGNGDIYYKEVNVYDVTEVSEGPVVIETLRGKGKKVNARQIKLF